MSDLKVTAVPRQVIEGKLLAALDDKSKVAVILSEGDLHLLIVALDDCVRTDKVLQMLKDLEKLREEAFC